DTLAAVGALFQHAAAAHGDLGIQPVLELRLFPILEASEVETADFVRAVVRAVARADAPVVDHVVQALGAVHRRAYGANLFARRIFALLARHGLEERLGIVERFILSARIADVGFDVPVVAVDANPVHLSSAHNLLFADHGDVVFRLASHDAGVASVAAVQVNGHRPAIL